MNNSQELRTISKFTRINEAIRANSLRVIHENGDQLGIMDRSQALSIAKEQGLDLVEISPDASPPVAKIINWGKYNYQRTKQLQKSKKNAKAAEIRQIRVGLKISDHDLGVKKRKADEFLQDGDKVKYVLVYRGRELAHKDIGFKLADKIIASYEGGVAVDQQPQFAGKQLTFVIRSIKQHAKTQNS